MDSLFLEPPPRLRRSWEQFLKILGDIGMLIASVAGIIVGAFLLAGS